jgi:hypothetical protein
LLFVMAVSAAVTRCRPERKMGPGAALAAAIAALIADVSSVVPLPAALNG